MLRKGLLFLIGGVICLYAFALRPEQVYACTATPPGQPSYTLADKVSAAPIILEGTVMEVAATPSNPLYEATIAVRHYFKGSGPAVVTVGRFGNSSMCLIDVKKDDHYIFFVATNPDGRWNAFYMSAGAAINHVDTAPAIIALTGTPTPPTGTDSASSSLAWTGVIGVIMVLILFLFGVIRSS
jgi:hypothetical protein